MFFLNPILGVFPMWWNHDVGVFPRRLQRLPQQLPRLRKQQKRQKIWLPTTVQRKEFSMNSLFQIIIGKFQSHFKQFLNHFSLALKIEWFGRKVSNFTRTKLVRNVRFCVINGTNQRTNIDEKAWRTFAEIWSTVFHSDFIRVSYKRFQELYRSYF